MATEVAPVTTWALVTMSPWVSTTMPVPWLVVVEAPLVPWAVRATTPGSTARSAARMSRPAAVPFGGVTPPLLRPDLALAGPPLVVVVEDLNAPRAPAITRKATTTRAAATPTLIQAWMRLVRPPAPGGGGP